MHQCSKIKHSPANKKRDISAPGDLAHREQRVITELSCGITLVWLDQVDQVVRYGGQSFGIRFGGTDIHMTVYLS